MSSTSRVFSPALSPFLFRENSKLAYKLPFCCFQSSELLTENERKSKKEQALAKHLLLFLSCQDRWNGRKGGVVEKAIHALKLSSRKCASARPKTEHVPLRGRACGA